MGATSSARRLFGTDGVRGVAGEFLTAELALALGRAATARSAVEVPQVLIVRDTRESGEMLESALAAGVAAAGGHALMGGVLPTPGAPLLARALRLPPGLRGLRLAQPLSGQRHQVLRGRRHEAPGRGRERDRGCAGRASRRRQPRGACGSCTARRTTTCVSSSRASTTWTSRACACCSTARTAPPTSWRPRSSAGWARPWRPSPSRRTGATSTRTAAPLTSARSRTRCARAATTSASPSTATATACSPPIATAWWWTATS